MDVYGWIQLHQLFDRRWQAIKTDAVNRRHADGAGNDVLDLVHLAEHQSLEPENLFGVFVKHFALACETKIFSAPLNQERFKGAFQRSDLLTHGGLGDLVDLGSFGKTLSLSQITK